MTNEGQTKLDRWLIFIVVIFCIIFLVGAFLYEIRQISPPEPLPVEGELIYLSNISNPNDTSVGVWLELILKCPKKFGDYTSTMWISITQNKKCIAQLWLKSSVVHTKNNITIEHIDLDNNSQISSHDRFHIYGHILTNSEITVHVNLTWKKVNLVGYSAMRVNIP